MAQVLTFKTDGTVEISAEKDAEKELGWLLKHLGKTERRGHKHSAKTEESTSQRVNS